MIMIRVIILTLNLTTKRYMDQLQNLLMYPQSQSSVCKLSYHYSHSMTCLISGGHMQKALQMCTHLRIREDTKTQTNEQTME